MHNEEIGIVDVKLHRLEEILHRLLLGAVAIDQIFACASEDDLPGDADLRIFFESDWGFLLVAIVEDDCDTRFCYSGLSTLIDKILTPYYVLLGRCTEDRIPGDSARGL